MLTFINCCKRYNINNDKVVVELLRGSEERDEELLRKRLWDPKQLVALDSLVCLLCVGAKMNIINVNVANFVLQCRASFLKTKLKKIDARFKRINSGS